MSNDENPRTLDEPKQIVCEGDADVAFVSGLLEARGVRDGFQLRKAKGRDGIATELQAMRALRGWGAVRALVIVVDNDDDPEAALRHVNGHLRDGLGPDVALPEAAFAFSMGMPAVAIATLPSADQAGCLETLLYDIAFRSPQGEMARDCVAALHDCAGAGAWDVSQQAKMRWHALVACVNRRDPGKATRYVLRGQPDAFDFRRASLDPLAAFLASTPWPLS